jgi:ankyrin repeat protein
MTKKYRFSILVTFLSGILFLCGCESDEAYFAGLYKTNCSEATSVAFEALSSQSTCNGTPLIIALARFKDPWIAPKVKNAIEYLSFNHLFDPGVIDARNGQNALLAAIDSDNEAMAQILLPYMNLETTDSQGQNFLHYLTKRNWASSSEFAFYPDQDLRTRLLSMPNNKNQNPVQVAYSNGNYSLLWTMISLGANIDFLLGNLSSLSPVWLFTAEISKNIPTLDDCGDLIHLKFTGLFADWIPGQKILNRNVKNYSLIHYASEKSLSNVIAYLISRGAELDSVSSEGSPLELALKSNIESRSNYESSVELLMNQPKALAAPGVVSGVLQTENMNWIERVLASPVNILSYQNLLMISCRDNACSQMRQGKAASSGLDLSGNNYWIQSIYASNGANIPSLENLPVQAFSSNKINQNIAHFLAYALPSNSKLLQGNFKTPMGNFLGAAKQHNLLNQKDRLLMTPVFYWLANPARLSATDIRSETKWLSIWLKNSEHNLDLNINRDSVLTLAVMTGKAYLVKEVLNYSTGFKKLINESNSQGQTPLHLATKMGSKEMITVLNSYR